MNKRFLALGVFAVLALAGQGCVPASWQKAPPIQGQAIKKITCQTIEQTRTAIHAEYTQQMELVSDEYWADYQVIQNNMRDCMDKLYEGNPCDEQWNALQASYANVSQDVTNDTLYNDYKAKQAEWNKCHNNFEEELKKYEEREKGKGEQCQQRFQSEITQLQAERKAQEEQAKQKRDADLAALAEFEKQCQASANTGGTGVVGGGKVVVVGGEGSEGVIPTPGPIQRNNQACGGGSTVSTPTIPGENTTPRTGKVAENPAKDVLTEMMTQAAEAITGTPIPTNAINDRIFAGIVCTKLYARILELQMAENDAEASGNRRELIRLRKELQRYRQAQAVWCAIAEGRPPTNLQSQIGQIANIAECKTDADCGEPVCCSNTEIGSWGCSAGKCVSNKKTCAANHICSGRPAACVRQPETIKVIEFQGSYIPINQIHSSTGPECDQEAHWHANRGSVTAVDGKVLIDAEDCGYGKVKDRPIIDIVVVNTGAKIEVRMNLGR